MKFDIISNSESVNSIDRIASVLESIMIQLQTPSSLETTTLWVYGIQTLIMVATVWVMIYQLGRLRKTFLSSNYGQFIALLKDLRMERVRHPDLARVYSEETEGMDDAEIRNHFFNLIVLSIFEKVYYDKNLGLVDNDTWKFWLESMKNLCNERSFKNMILRQSYKIANPELVKILREYVLEAESQDDVTDDN